MFDKKQIKFMKKIHIPIDFGNVLSDDDLVVIEELVSDHLQKYGFDEDYSPTEDGKMCESILDIL